MLNKAGFEWEPDKGKKEPKRRSGGKSRLLRNAGDGGNLMSEDEGWDDDYECDNEQEDDDLLALDDEEEDEMVALIIRHVDEIARKNEAKRKEWEREEAERQQIEAEWSAIQNEWQEIERERRQLECQSIAIDVKKRKLKERKTTLKAKEKKVTELLKKSQILHQRIGAEQSELTEKRRLLADAQKEERQRMQHDRQLWNIQRKWLEDEISELRKRLASAMKEASLAPTRCSTCQYNLMVEGDTSTKQEFSLDEPSSAAANMDEKETNAYRMRKRKKVDCTTSSLKEPSDKEQEISTNKFSDEPSVSSSAAAPEDSTRFPYLTRSSLNRTKRAVTHDSTTDYKNKRQKRDQLPLATSLTITTTASTLKTAKKDKPQQKTRPSRPRSPTRDNSEISSGRRTGSSKATPSNSEEPLSQSSFSSATLSITAKRKKRVRAASTGLKVGTHHHGPTANNSDAAFSLSEPTVHC